MNEACILIPCSALATFSPGTRSEVLAYAGLTGPAEPAPARDKVGTAATPAASEEGPPDLTVAMARKLIAAPINPKSLAILRLIADGETPEFHLADAVRAAPGADTYMDIRGAWAGITRRARKILDDGDADLIWWRNPTYDENDNYVDHIGRVSDLTHQSLRAAFGIRAGN